MDTVFILLTCCLSLAFTEATAENGLMNLQNTSTETGKDIGVNSTSAPLSNSTENLTISTTLIAATTLTSAAENNETSTRSTSATTTASSLSPTSESTTTVVPFTNRTQSTVITTDTKTETSVPHTEKTTKDSPSTISATVTTNATSSVVNATSESVRTTQGAQLSGPEKILTITFGVMLGFFVLVIVAIKLHRWSYKLQFLHQPINDTEDLIVPTDDPDTLVVSGGLYDGHPIYDHVPPDRQDESQFRLEFLH